VVDVVAAANVGYLIVFILMPLAYVVLQRQPDGDPRGLRLPGAFRALAIALAAVNAVVLVVGGAQWGPQVVAVGLGVSLLILPMSWATRRVYRQPPAVESARVPDQPSPIAASRSARMAAWRAAATARASSTVPDTGTTPSK
jgi:amino acid transporter